MAHWLSLSATMFWHNRKRSVFNVLSIAIAMFFALSIMLLYQNYERAQLENAYAHAGKWDFRILNADESMQNGAASVAGVEDTQLLYYDLTALLDPVLDTEREGPSADFVKHWMLSLVELPLHAQHVLPLDLSEGEWPRSENEIVLPRDFIYDGLKVRSGQYRIGDTIELTVGKRLLPDLSTTQKRQLDADETFEEDGTRLFRISGVLAGDLRKAGEYVETAFIGVSDRDHQSGVLFIHGAADNSAEFQAVKHELGVALSIDSTDIEVNEAVDLAIRLIETSNVAKQFRRTGIILIGILLVLMMTIVITSQSYHFRVHQRQFSILLVNGASNTFVGSVIWFNNLLVFLLAGIIAVGACLLQMRFYSTYVSRLLAEQGDRFAFEARMYPREMILFLLLVFVLISVLPYLFSFFIPARNLRPYLVGQGQYNKKLAADASVKLPIWMRIHVRNIVTFFTLVLSMVISVSVLSVGLVASHSIAKRSAAEVNQYAADFYMVKSLAGDDARANGDEIISGLPAHQSAYRYYGAGAEFSLPNERLSPALKAYFRNTDTSVVLGSNLLSLDETLFKLVKGDELISFDAFSENQVTIFYNEAYLTKEHAEQTNDSDSVQFSEDQPFYKNRIIEMTTYQPGDVITLDRVYGIEKKFPLTVVGTTRHGFGELKDDLPQGGLYVSEQTFFDAVGNAPYYLILLISTTKDEQADMAAYLSKAGSLHGYYFQDNSNLTRSARVSSEIQLTFVYSLMVLALMIALLNCLSLWGYEALQQRRTMVIRRVFGQSSCQGVVQLFLSRLFVLVMASLIFLLVMLVTLIFGGEVLAFYDLNVLSISIGLVMAFVFHAILILILSFIHQRQSERKNSRDMLAAP